jgi:[ribosomal protein S5]-alanine N-acetyltransferase
LIDGERLALAPATCEALQAELDNDLPRLGDVLRARVDPTWPPALYGPQAAQFMLDLLARDPASANWGTHYFVLKGGWPTLIGVGGYKGAARDGDIELGYSVVSAHQRRGYASEATRMMTARAFTDPGVQRVIAHTLAELTPSIGVLEKCGFRLQPNTKEEGAIMYALAREDWHG